MSHEHKIRQKIRGHACEVSYLDTGGDPEFRECIEEDWVPKANAFMLVMDVENPASMDYLRDIESLLAAAPSMLGGVLVGNLPSGDEHNRKVSRNEAAAFAKSLLGGQLSYVEVNTRSGLNIAAPFQTLMENIAQTVLKSPSKKLPSADTTLPPYASPSTTKKPLSSSPLSSPESPPRYSPVCMQGDSKRVEELEALVAKQDTRTEQLEQTVKMQNDATEQLQQTVKMQNDAVNELRKQMVMLLQRMDGR